jgi:hypothetical protein
MVGTLCKYVVDEKTIRSLTSRCTGAAIGARFKWIIANRRPVILDVSALKTICTLGPIHRRNDDA